MSASTSTSRRPVFYPNPSPSAGEPFLRGHCSGLGDGPLTVTPCDTGGDPVQLTAADVCPRSEAEPEEGVADAASLAFLNEPSLLDNIARRYAHDRIYTYVGPVLLAVNPYKTLAELYSREAMDAYRGRAIGVLPPHVFAIADRARRMILSDRRSQSIVVSGESGAGKTESCRAIVDYLAHHSREEAEDLCTAMLSASPLLEAFGCASTLRNKNSSRFGKLMRIWTAAGGASFSHSSIETYLLEKGRVSNHAPGERTFHVLYYIAAAAAAAGAGTDATAAAAAAAIDWAPLAAVTEAARGGGAGAFRLLCPSGEAAQGGDAAPHDEAWGSTRRPSRQASRFREASTAHPRRIPPRQTAETCLALPLPLPLSPPSPTSCPA